MNIKRSYSGQAIAIIMVVLVVATVIGASLFSRIVKNRALLVDQKESSRALEQADMLLDLLISSPDLGAVEGNIDSCLASEEGCTWNGVGEFVEAFNGLVSEDIVDKVDDWCEDSNSGIRVLASRATLESGVDFSVGSVKSIKVTSLNLTSPCSIDFKFGSASDGDEIFTIKKVYANSSGEIKPYEEDDMLVYCISSGSCDPSVIQAADGTIEDVADGDVISIDLADSPDGYFLYEIRIIPLYGTLNIAWEADSCAGDTLFDYKVNAQVNCKGDYREKEVVLPNVKLLGYDPIFDYTIYNAEGKLKPMISN